MQTVSVHAQSQSTFKGQPSLLRTHKPQSQIRAHNVRQTPRNFRVFAKIDTGYKAGGGQKSTVEDQLHEAEIDKNANAFVKEFKEDLGATGDKKTDEDKNDIQQRQDDKLGLKRDEKDAKRVEDSKK
ncbi:hypothetical protein WJX79_008359 [Trebouxia sp. C0005]|nr:MAG: hypothetical protein FRX49_06475 [Trebouxia sp. A1-2]